MKTHFSGNTITILLEKGDGCFFEAGPDRINSTFGFDVSFPIGVTNRIEQLANEGSLVIAIDIDKDSFQYTRAKPNSRKRKVSKEQTQTQTEIINSIDKLIKD